MYTVDYFIKKFSAIPDNKWTVGTFQDINGRACALGHCGMGIRVDTDSNNESTALLGMVRDYLRDKGYPGSVACVNDGESPLYHQSTPKKRVLAVLTDIKNSLPPQYDDITKSLAVLPVAETADVPVKELV